MSPDACVVCGLGVKEGKGRIIHADNERGFSRLHVECDEARIEAIIGKPLDD